MVASEWEPAGRVGLMHPFDVPPARAAFVGAVALRVLASPSVCLGATMLLWAISNNPVTPVVGPLVGAVLVLYVQRHLLADAWAHIPRRKQDVARSDPVGLSVLAATIQGLAFFGSLILLKSRIGGLPSSMDVGSLTFGMLVAFSFGILASLVWDGIAPRRFHMATAPRTIALLFGMAQLLGVLLVLVNSFRDVAVNVPVSAWGASAAVALAAGTVLFRLIPTFVACLPARFWFSLPEEPSSSTGLQP